MSQSAPDMLLRGAGRGMDARQPEQPPRRTVRENAATLAAVPLFAGFSKKHLQRLAAEADELTFDKRDVIVEEGMLGETLFRHTLVSLLRDEPRLTLKLLDGIVRRIREVQRRNLGR